MSARCTPYGRPKARGAPLPPAVAPSPRPPNQRPRVPCAPEYAAEVDVLVATAERILSDVLPGRRAAAVVAACEAVTAPTARVRAQAVTADHTLAGAIGALRSVGERLESVGGPRLLEAAVDCIAPHDTPAAHLRRHLVRGAWHRLGQRDFEFFR